MDEQPKEFCHQQGSLEAVHGRWAPVEARVATLREDIRRACASRLPGENHNRANERQVEEFIARLREDFPGRIYEFVRARDAKAGEVFAHGWEDARCREDSPCVVIERQRLSPWALRTTRWNYVFTVPGENRESFVLVAHYDTWRGPGADDNTTGEEILKQYLLADLNGEKRPRLTHTYFLAGSEECGLVGLLSQLLLAAGIIVGIQALQQEQWWRLAVALALCPLASYRFGVSGSREYVRALRAEELDCIRAVVSVDSVGEGRLFIPRSTLGADLIRALIPYGNYDAFTDLLEEGAHLHGIKYNNYLAGGTTDHLSFLEINNGLWTRVRESFRWALHWVSRRPYRAPRRIPASALVAMSPGKASPVVFGGKIHTPRDVPERVHAQPLQEALLITDYVFHILEGSPRVRKPRKLDEFHYVRLYEIQGGQKQRFEYWLVFKDAIEPNRRNLNAVYQAAVEFDEAKKQGTARLGEILGWGVDTRLRDEVAEICAAQGKTFRRVRLDQLTVTSDGTSIRFARLLTVADSLQRHLLRTMAWAERQMGGYSLLTFFAIAYLISWAVGKGLSLGFRHWFAFQSWFFHYQAVTFPLVLLFQLMLLLYLMVRAIPTWIDNHYRHENRADNMGSLRRLSGSSPFAQG
ncbi:MAG: M28 family peptidase [Acidobacteria bacterium]|nr:M28 family peptidase [Acidobacteriota bacterium]